MNPDEIRQKRLQKLASSSSSAGSGNSAAKAEKAVEEEKPKKVSVPVTEEVKKSVPAEPQKPKLKPQIAVSTPQKASIRSVLTNQDGPEVQIEDIDAVLWENLPRKPLHHLQSIFRRAQQLPSPEVVRGPVVTIAVLSCTADPSEEIFNSLNSFVIDELKGRTLDPEFVCKIINSAIENEMEIHPMVWSVAIAALATVRFGDPEAALLFNLLMEMLDNQIISDILLALPKPPRDPKLMPVMIAQHTFLGMVLGRFGPQGNAFFDSLPTTLTTSIDTPIDEFYKAFAKDSVPVAKTGAGYAAKLVTKLVRQSSKSRRLVLDWFKLLLNANHKTVGSNWRPEQCNDLQLLITALQCLFHLADPFVKLDQIGLKSQLAKISDKYFASKVCYDISDETKVHANQSAPFNQQQLELDLNFVTECFFLTVGMLHYGAYAAIEAIRGGGRGSLMRFAQYIEEHTRAQLASPPGRAARPEVKQQLTLRVLRAKAAVAGIRARLADSELLGQLLRFSLFTLSFDANLALKGKEITAAYQNPPPESFASLPEFFLESPVVVATHVMLTKEYFRDSSMAIRPELGLNAAILFMSSPELVSNPFLRSRFAEFIGYGGSDLPLVSGGTVPGPLAVFFTTNECRTYLLPALMAVFIDIERTGRSQQFYEKFTTRELVAQILQILWRDNHYQRQLTLESEQKPDFFVKFVALLLNDTTFVLDESLGLLLKIHKEQHSGSTTTAASTTASTTAATTETQTETETEPEPTEPETDADGDVEMDEEPTNSDSTRRRARNMLSLSTEYMTLLLAFTQSVPQIFSTPEIIDRFAVMLNYNLAALVGPRCSELKISNPIEIGFNPKQLLSDVVKVYLAMRKQAPFARAIAKDERSYKAEIFARAATILQTHSLVSPIELDQFQKLAVRAEQAWQETQEEDEDFDDVPDEFLDPLMYTIMEDPVTLPTSKVNIDLSTIKTHLLSDPTDPFNRVPLKIEDVVRNDELREQIAEFKRQKRRS